MSSNHNIVSLTECKSCNFHRGMLGSCVRCNRIKEFISLSLSMPSNYNDGFKNGEMIVRCLNTKLRR